jgi:hypothetical protein
MQVINNFRAHVLNHSSAAEKMGKHELACKIMSVKQEKNEGKCLKLLDKVQCNAKKLNKLLDKQEKYQKLTATIKSSYKTEMTSAQVLSKLTCKLNESPELLKTQGIFRLSVAAGGPTAQDILATANIMSLKGKFDEEPGIIISSAIKKEFENALTVEDKANISELVDKCSKDNKLIPSLGDLPEPLCDVITTFQHVAGYSNENKMSTDNLSTIMAMKLIDKNEEISKYKDFINRCIKQKVTVETL